MIIDNNIISFEEKDWKNGIAKEVIALLKINKCKYNPMTKEWTANDIVLDSIKMLLEAQREQDDFIDTFGIDKNNNVIESGLLSLFKHIKDIKELIQELSDRNASDKIIDEYSKILDQLNKQFNSLISEKHEEELI